MALLPEYQLVIAGIGPEEKNLRKLAKDLGIEHSVKFLGLVSQDALPALLSTSGVFVRPSRSEGLGIAFLEAMAAGVPVIATPVGGIPDFLKDNETGLLCEPENPRSVADAIRRITEPGALRDHISVSALRLVRQRFNWDMIARQYHEIISYYSRI